MDPLKHMCGINRMQKSERFIAFRQDHCQPMVSQWSALLPSTIFEHMPSDVSCFKGFCILTVYILVLFDSFWASKVWSFVSASHSSDASFSMAVFGDMGPMPGMSSVSFSFST